MLLTFFLRKKCLGNFGLYKFLSYRASLSPYVKHTGTLNHRNFSGKSLWVNATKAKEYWMRTHSP